MSKEDEIINELLALSSMFVPDADNDESMGGKSIKISKEKRELFKATAKSIDKDMTLDDCCREVVKIQKQLESIKNWQNYHDGVK